MSSQAALDRLLLCLVMVLLAVSPAQGQDFDASPGGWIFRKLMTHKDTQNRAYVVRYHHLFSPRISTGSKSTSFGFGGNGKPGPGSKTDSRYYPNAAAIIGAGIFYDTYGLWINYVITNNQPERVAAYGTTRYFEAAINSYQTRYGFGAYYQSYHGFFEGPNSFGLPKLKVNDPYTQRPDILLRNSGAYAYGIANWRKFSMQAAFQHTKRQVRSAGSFLYQGAVNYITIRGDSLNTPLARDLQENNDKGLLSFTRGRFLSVNASAGYGHSFVVRRLYVTGVLFVGPGVQYQNLYDPKVTRNFFSPYLGTNLKGALGYNGDRFFTSIQAMFDGNRNYMRGVRLQASSSSYVLQLGYRF